MSFGSVPIDELWLVGTGGGGGGSAYRDYAGRQTGFAVDALAPQSRDLYNMDQPYLGQGTREVAFGLPVLQTSPSVTNRGNVAVESGASDAATQQLPIGELTTQDWFWPAVVIAVLLVLK